MSPKSAKEAEPQVARDERAFLGEEFLTWLWWRFEAGESEYDLGGGRSVGIALDGPLVLRDRREDEEGKRPEQSLRHGRPLSGVEAAAALKRGKRLVRARLIVADADREWNTTFDAETFSLRSCSVPESEEEEAHVRALETVTAYEQISTALDGVFRTFLLERLSPEYTDRSLPKLRDWVRSKPLS